MFFFSFRFYVQDTVCVQAIKNIQKGEEICENYGPIFFHSNRKDRQVLLKVSFVCQSSLSCCKK